MKEASRWEEFKSCLEPPWLCQQLKVAKFHDDFKLNFGKGKSLINSIIELYKLHHGKVRLYS